MPSQRQGFIIWQNARIDWKYLAFKEDASFELHPHFELKATNSKTGEWVEWKDIEVQDDSLNDKIKGITDFTKLPKPLMVGILNNAVAKLYETPPELSRITPNGLERL